MPDKIYLRQMQSLPLIAKVHMSQARIREWYDYFNGNVFISFSGGKDSTALAHVVHEYYPDVPLVFCNTGLEYPEIQEFARKMGAEFIRPKMSFSEVISTYGYPIISKENAEAIHYARKIRNGGAMLKLPDNASNSTDPGHIGGGGTILHHRKELMGQRVHTKAEQDGEEQHWKGNLSPDSMWGVQRIPGNETNRRRADITATRNQWDGLIGINGEDEPLPG